jgi:hypothetical protein
MRKKNLLLIFCLLLGFTAYAQQRVSGIVADVTNEPIPGLTILEKGTGNGVITDIDGNYTINVSGSNSILVFSFIGMQTQEIEVGNRPVINVVMSDDLTDLDELLRRCYAYGRQ